MYHIKSKNRHSIKQFYAPIINYALKSAVAYATLNTQQYKVMKETPRNAVSAEIQVKSMIKPKGNCITLSQIDASSVKTTKVKSMI